MVQQDDYDEKKLIDLAKTGDREAFEELRRRHEKKVYGYIRSRVKIDADAKDVAQNTWKEIWRKIATYDGDRAGNKFIPFVFYRAKIKIVDHQTQVRTRRTEPLSDLARQTSDSARKETEEEVADRLGRLEIDPTESAVERAEAYDQMIRLAFHGSSPPHQLIAYGFCKLLEWKPSEVVSELSDLPLREAARRLEADYASASTITRGRVASWFTSMHQSMDKKFSQVVIDQKTLETYPGLLDRVVGDTKLSDYYLTEASANVAHWWEAVRRRSLTELSK